MWDFKRRRTEDMIWWFDVALLSMLDVLCKRKGWKNLLIPISTDQLIPEESTLRSRRWTQHPTATKKKWRNDSTTQASCKSTSKLSSPRATLTLSLGFIHDARESCSRTSFFPSRPCSPVGRLFHRHSVWKPTVLVVLVLPSSIQNDIEWIKWSDGTLHGK